MEKQFRIKQITQFFVLVLFILFPSWAVAQQSTVKGLVKDETGIPVIGANVSVKGTTNGVVTDTNGRFILSNVKAGATIMFSYVTYTTKEIVYKGQSNIIVTLAEDNKLLDEVVVIGYGQVRKGDATGALTSLKADDKIRGFAPNTQDLLVGKVAGVAITSEGGSPNGASFIRIRGWFVPYCQQ